MAGIRKISDDMVPDILVAVVAGETLTAIAGRHGVTADSIARVIAKRGLKPRCYHTKRQRMIRMHQEGYSLDEISTALQVRRRRVGVLLRDCGFDIPLNAKYLPRSHPLRIEARC
jgi:hypothetical protein